MMLRTSFALLALLAACSAPAPSSPHADASLSGSTSGTVPAVDPALRARANLLVTRALEDNEAIAILAELLRAAPKRLSGSPGAEAAVRFGLAKMQALGLDNAHLEPCMVPHWVRGQETASVVSPRELPLRITALGGSIATPETGLTAEVIEVRTFEQLHELGAAAAGKIVFFNRPMPRALRNTGQAYGEAVPQRTNGAIEAAKVGAVGALVRSMTTAIDEFPHTGMMSYEAGTAQVPAAAICTQDAEQLSALLKQGPVRVQLLLGCSTQPDAPSANVVGEVRGTEQPEDVVLIGAHLDAWDLGLGAHDDGAGCAHVLEALRLLKATGVHCKRTIRGVLFMNEENGTRGAKAYELAHLAEVQHICAAVETDSGGFAPQGFSCSLKDERAAEYRQLFAPLEEFNMGAFLAGGGGGADIGPLGAHGVPLFGLVVVGHRYFDFHHSAQDTIAQVNDRELALGAAALAYAASVLADK